MCTVSLSLLEVYRISPQSKNLLITESATSRYDSMDRVSSLSLSSFIAKGFYQPKVF